MQLFKKNKYYNPLFLTELSKNEITIDTAPSFFAALQLLVNELARFNFIFNNCKDFEKIFYNVKTTKNTFINSDYEVKRYIYSNLLLDGVVTLVFFDRTYIFTKNEFIINYNKNGDFSGIILNDNKKTKISSDYVVIINLSDVNEGGFKDWLKDVIDLEKNLIQFISVYTKNFGLYGAYKLKTEEIDDRLLTSLQFILKDARLKLQKGALPVLPNALDFMNAEMKSEILQETKDYIIKTVCRVMGIPLLLFQSREGGAYALAKEEYKTFYYTTLQSYIELVRSAIEKYAKKINPEASIKIDFSNIDFLSDAREFDVGEINILLNQGVINVDEARKFLKIDNKSDEEKQERKNIGTVKEESKNRTENNDADNEKILSGGRTEKGEGEEEKDLTDEEIWDWHKNNIETLEKKTAREMLQAYNNNLASLVRKNFNKTKDKNDVEIDINDIAKVLAEVVSNVIFNNSKIAVKRSLNNNLFNVYIKPESLFEAIEKIKFNNVDYFYNSFTKDIADMLENLITEDGYYSADDIINNLKNCFTKERATTIARTEINKVCSLAHVKNSEAMQDIAEKLNLKVLKRWSTAKDEKVRQTHLANGMQGWIDYNEKFQNGLLHPYDTQGGANEIINCRCVLLTKLADKEDI
ncbi:MAG: phage portal protein [Candidatus Omnitrophica bacterium]|nr:phage portal protein [Candidatus Omnitrophota bacterium]